MTTDKRGRETVPSRHRIEPSNGVAVLPMTELGKVVLVLVVATIALRFLVLARDEVDRNLLVAILATGVLVGPAEELVLRGVVQRCLRTHRRPESIAAWWTAVGPWSSPPPAWWQ